MTRVGQTPERTYIVRIPLIEDHRRPGRVIRVWRHPQGQWFVENCNSCSIEPDGTPGATTTLGGFGVSFEHYADALAQAERLVAEYEAHGGVLVSIQVGARK